MDVRAAGFDQLDAITLYRLLKLRVDVFVVEQRCAYPELDGRDTEPGTVHVWTALAPDGDPVGYLRILTEAYGGTRIGRVAVAPAARGAGVARELMTAALSLVGDRSCVLDAQAHLVEFYRGFGFAQAGPQYDEDGIPHVPMRRPGGR